MNAIPSQLRFSFLLLMVLTSAHAQTLINVDFGGNTQSTAIGIAAVGLSTNDFWNAYSHYSPRFSPGLPPQPIGRMEGLHYSDGTSSPVAIAVTNAPGVWGNSTGDLVFDSYIFASNGSNLVATIHGLPSGRYHFVLYGHADADSAPEQNTLFSLRVGDAPHRWLGPLTSAGAAGWRVGQPWQEGRQYVLFRDVAVADGESVTIDGTPGPGGIAVLNALQILSRGSGPPRLAVPTAPVVLAEATNLTVRSVRYTGRVRTGEARFQVEIHVEAPSAHTQAAPLFEGEVAVISGELPPLWRWFAQGGKLWLHPGTAGTNTLKLELVTRVTRAEPWESVAFTGPPAGVSTLDVRPEAADAEIQLLAGSPTEVGPAATKVGTNGLHAVLAGDARVSFRWQSRAAEVTRDAVITVDTTVQTRLLPSVVRTTTTLEYDVVQGEVARLMLALPAGLTVTRLTGTGVRDWKWGNESGLPAANVPTEVAVEFVRPLQGRSTLILETEQTVPGLPRQVSLSFPRAIGVQRESGAWSLANSDVTAQISKVTGARQVNASTGELAAYRFTSEPTELKADLSSVVPRIQVKSRVSGVLEESRLLCRQVLALQVTQAGIYGFEADVPAGWTVTSVAGEGVGDWQVNGSQLQVSLAGRPTGQWTVSVQLEQVMTSLAGEVVLTPIRVHSAVEESAQITAAAMPGLTLRTGTLDGVREQPASGLAGNPATDSPSSGPEPQLAFVADTGVWRIVLATERLPPRLVAEVFNLVTVGDGQVGGSATIRYAIVNQGVQSFQVRVPRHWKNIEFTGANVRRTDHQEDLWTVALQDKAWGAYTLVLTYDYTFDPKKDSLDGAGAHPLGAERETGTSAITAAPGVEVTATAVAPPLRTLDPTELASTDRAFIARPVLLAYRYEGTNFALNLEVIRHEAIPVLDAVADRTQLTSVLTEQGEMLTQATFFVKNNERQYQRFQLPEDASLWGVAVNGEPAKADRDGDWVLVNLPTAANRDEVFTIDLNYAQQYGKLSRGGGLLKRTIDLTAPQTDVPGTYAQWELYTPDNRHISQFGGNMNPPPGVQYAMSDAWEEFIRFYKSVLAEYGTLLLFALFPGLLAVFWWRFGRSRGFQGVMAVFFFACLLLVLAGMLLPALAKAKVKAQHIASLNNMKQIGIAAQIYAADHQGRWPESFEDFMTELGTDKVLYHPGTGERYTYVPPTAVSGNTAVVIAYGPEVDGRRQVVMIDGSAREVTTEQFESLVPRSIADNSLLSRRLGLPRSSLAASPGEQPKSAASPTPSLKAEVPVKTEPELMLRFRQTTDPKSMDETLRKIEVAENFAVNGKATAAGAGGMGGGAMGFGVKPPVSPAAPASVAGLRSLRIEIPRTGKSSHFTRVLNLSGEPARLTFSIISARMQTFRQSGFQLITFLLGLLWARYEWGAARPSIARLAVAIGLALVGLVELFLSFRALHLVFIVLPPAVVALGVLYLLQRRWKRRSSGPNTPPSDEPPSMPSASDLTPIPPPLPHSSPGATMMATAILVVLGWLGGMEPRHLQAQETNTAPVAGVLKMEMTGTAGEKIARFDATLDLTSSGTNAVVDLFGSDIAIQEMVVTTGEARLVRQAGRAAILMSQPGRATIHLRWWLNVGGDANRRTLEGSLPAAVGTHLKLEISEPNAVVEFPGALALTRTEQGPLTILDAVLGSAPHLSLSWAPRQSRVSAPPTVLLAEQATLATLANGVASLRTVMEFTAPQGEAQSFQLAFPRSQRLVRVSGETVRTWNFSPTNRFEVTVELTKPSATARVVVETEQTLETLPASVSLAVPSPRGVRRTTGWVVLKTGEELGLTVDRSVGLDRVEASAVTSLLGAELGTVHSTWRFLNPAFEMGLRVEILTPRMEVTIDHQLTVGFDQVIAHVHGNLQVTRSGVFAVRFLVPNEYRVEQVECRAQATHVERRTPIGRILEITLQQRTIGEIPFEIRLIRSLSNLPPSLVLTGVTPQDAARITGYVSASAEAGVSLKTSAFPGLAEIPASSLPKAGAGTAGWLAFKRLSSNASTNSDWSLTLATESLDSWVRAETASFITVGESFASGRTLIRYDIQNAPIQEFIVRVPALWRNVEITGPGIRRRDQTNRASGTDWRIELQNKVRGDFRLQVKWEQLRGETNEFSVSGLEVVGVERETGAVAFFTRGQIQLIPPATNTALLRLDARELPDWAELPSRDPARLSYRYLRSGWQVSLGLRQYQDAALLQALIEQARLRTVVADDGQMMTQMELMVRNNGRQNLELTLPSDAEVWSAFVKRDPVRPLRRDGRILIPLENSDATGAAVPVEITYIVHGAFPRHRGTVQLLSPQLDLPLKDAEWELFLPPDYNYSRFDGSMSFQTGDLTVGVSEYSMDSYNRQQSEQSMARQATEEALLAEARRDLASRNYQNSGNLRRLNRWKDRGSNGRGNQALKELSDALSTAQSSNLMEAQEGYQLDNNLRLDSEVHAIGQSYDANVAKLQVAQLNRAQAVVTTQVSPLRVNLPTRGMRYNFSQVLQTQPGQPLSVSFYALNERDPGWWRTASRWLVVPVVLWIVSAVILFFRPERS